MRLHELGRLLGLAALLELLQVQLHLAEGEGGHRLLIILQQHLGGLGGQQALGGEGWRGERSLAQGLRGVEDVSG